MTSENSHWGEIKEAKRSDDWNISFDVDDLLTSASPPPPMYQPSKEEASSFQILPTEICQSDPVVLHTIKLLQHQRQLLQLITRPQAFGLELNSTPPPFPEDPPKKKKTSKFQFQNFTTPNDVASGSTTTPSKLTLSSSLHIEMEGSVARQVLRKAVATVLAHAGFTDTTESVLRTMTDAAHHFLGTATSLLRANTDTAMINGQCSFHDVVEQTLHDLRLGGMAELHRLHRDRVVNYHLRVRQRTLQLHQHYINTVNAATATNSNIVSTASNVVQQPLLTPTNVRRESWTMTSDGVSVQMTVADDASIPTASSAASVVMTPPVQEDVSLVSVRSNSSLEHDASSIPSMPSFSVHSQAGAEEEQQSPALSQNYVFTASR